MKNIHLLPTYKPSRLHLGGLGLVLCDLVFDSNTIYSQHIYITSDEDIKEECTIDLYLNKVVTSEHENSYLYNQNKRRYKKIILTTDQDLIADGVQAIDDEFLEWFVKNPSCEYVTVYDGIFGEDRVCKKYIIIPKEKPKRKIDTCYNFNEEIGCVQPDCKCEKEEPKQETGKEFYKSADKVITVKKQETERGLIIKKSDGSIIKQETLEEAAERIFTSAYTNYKVRRQGFIKGAKWRAERMYSEEDMIEFHKWAFQKNRIEESDKTTKELLLEWFEQFKNK